MPDAEIEFDFPRLVGMPYELASDASLLYNCIAFAFGDEHNNWDPQEGCGFSWPPGFKREATIEVITNMVQLHGYRTRHENLSNPPTRDAIAIYAHDAGLVTHLAKWQSPGIWKSKLGEGRDINHHSLDWLESDLYGRPASIWKREAT